MNCKVGQPSCASGKVILTIRVFERNMVVIETIFYANSFNKKMIY